MIFNDRKEAGVRLAERLLKFKKEKPVVLAIPRGGVTVANEIAKALCAPIGLIIPRKIGAPYNPELAVAAVTQDGDLLLNEELIISLDIPPDYIEKEKKIQMEEIKRRFKRYGAVDIELKNRVVILTDDGIATGFTVLAAIRSVKKKNPAKIILAVPVAPSETIEEMKKEVDEVICLHSPHYFNAISQFYRNFPQTTDKEVIEILRNLGKDSGGD